MYNLLTISLIITKVDFLSFSFHMQFLIIKFVHGLFKHFMFIQHSNMHCFFRYICVATIIYILFDN